MLSACTTQEEAGFLGSRLAPCSGQDTIFATLPFRDWPQRYHGTVERVVEEHVEALRRISSAPLECQAATALGTLTPSPRLREIAQTLSPWRTPLRLSSLSQLHIGPVLLEYLRIYECANLERLRALPVIIEERRGGTLTSPSNSGPWSQGDFAAEANAQRQQIEREQRLARPALERTLSVLGSMDDLRGVLSELECLKRTSLDLRNALGLAADASACLAKVPGKSSLRDLATP